MENANAREKLSNFLFSEIKRKITLAGVWCVGLILVIIPLLRPFGPYDFIMALGVSLVVGIPIAFYIGNRLGWPLGFWIGVIGGLIVSPPVALLIGGSVTAYYASFLGPISGGLVGRWTELNDKKRLKKGMDRISK